MCNADLGKDTCCHKVYFNMSSPVLRDFTVELQLKLHLQTERPEGNQIGQYHLNLASII